MKNLLAMSFVLGISMLGSFGVYARGHEPVREFHVHTLFRQLDSNRDGIIDGQEVAQAGLSHQFMRLADHNHDHIITMRELEHTRFAISMDENHDGALTLNEVLDFEHRPPVPVHHPKPEPHPQPYPDAPHPGHP
ncbi:hypothetical protein [Celerinatantimonas sp. MCCC 1A17872]|uniref:hypothetical protein n=1 Tax=Celerinatantimonas sp. MCCC 1A17872 TaxID=3177514 RepID=UPI0038C40B85